MNANRLSFRSSIPEPFFLALTVAMLIGLAPQVALHGLNLDWEVVARQLVFAAITVLGLLLLAVFLFEVHVSEEGLRCYTFYGNYRTFAWSDINGVRPVNMLGLRYLRVSSVQGGPPLWVPLFLADREGFRLAVSGLAGEDHVMTRALNEAG
jgi:hypothetical protein